MSKQFNPKGLLPPQIDHTKRLLQSLDKNGISHDASGTGMGKTYCALSAMKHRKRPFVVVTPKLNIPKWYKVAKEFGVKPELVINYEKLARGNMEEIYRYKERGVSEQNENIKIASLPYFLRGEWKIPKTWDVVLDESHRSKGVDSLNSGLLYSLTRQKFNTLCLSATQAMTPLDMRAFGFATGLHKGMHHISGRFQNYGMNLFKEFCEKSGAQFTGSFGAMYFDSSDPASVEKLQNVRRYLFEETGISSRMNRADFGDIFQNNQIDPAVWDMGENGKKIGHIYDDMATELARLDERTQNYRAHVLAILTKARRHAELLKVPSLVEKTEGLWEEGRSVIIFVNYTDTIEALFSRLSGIKGIGAERIGQIYGGRTTKQCTDDLNSFQSNAKDRKQIMLVNLAAGAEAIDMHDLFGDFPRAAIINPSYRAISVVQSIGRPDRAYAKSDILTFMALAAGTIEESVGCKFNDKKGHLDILNDGDLIPDGAIFNVLAGYDR